MSVLKEYKFDFCTVYHRDDNILVFEINEGIEVDAEMSDKLTRMADQTMTGPFGILANRINSYSLSFEAMTALAQYDNMSALAVVVYNAKSRLLVEAQNYFIAALRKKPIKIFVDIDSAAAWLQTVIHNPTENTSSNIQ